MGVHISRTQSIVIDNIGTAQLLVSIFLVNKSESSMKFGGTPEEEEEYTHHVSFNLTGKIMSYQ